jgi:hypothetical protein
VNYCWGQGPMLAVASFEEEKKNIQCLIVYKLYPHLLKVVYPSCTHTLLIMAKDLKTSVLGEISL